MPELPEVETVCRTLRNYVTGKKIIACEVYEGKCIKNSQVNEFKDKLKNQKINAINRRGKHIIFILDEYVLISHLRMEGKYWYLPSDKKISMKHILLTLFLDDQFALNYHDTRRFGTFHIFKINEFEQSAPINKLGKEPFDNELTAKILFDKWSKRKKPIKSLLLEQDLIAGIGNIYADEILFAARIHPLTFGSQLSLNDCENILKNTKIILEKAIKLGGSTIASYSSDGVHGKFQNELFVYHRQNQNCRVCNSIICQIKINGRSTHFCPNCQKSKIKDLK